MAEELRKDKPGMKGVTIRKRVGAAWSESVSHFCTFSSEADVVCCWRAYREEEG